MADSIDLTNAPEIDITVIEGDKLSAENATIIILKADDTNLDMTAYADVELNIYRDEDFRSRIHQFKNTAAPSTMTLGDGFFILLADPFSLQAKTYRYALRELDSPLTLSIGHFIVKRRH